MDNRYSILFAFRDRDHLRVKNCMQSLRDQSDNRFEVIFVDYGSRAETSENVEDILSGFSFVKYYYVAHPGLLWNKSKAFNYGIKKSTTDFIITADIDLIFHPEFIEKISNVTFKDSFTVFSYAYLPKSLTVKDISGKEFSELKPSHIGNITGSGIYPKKALEEIHGFDEFYHFYGSEDEDLFIRLENFGLKKIPEPQNMLVHQWHPRYPFEEKNELSEIPKVHNIRRINMVHCEHAEVSGRKIPKHQEKWGECHEESDLDKLSLPDYSFQLDCREAQVTHFLNERLRSINGIVYVKFCQSSDKITVRNLIKKFVGKRSEPVLSLKKVNDLVLKTIVYNYRHHNYFYKVDLTNKCIVLKINLLDG